MKKTTPSTESLTAEAIEANKKYRHQKIVEAAIEVEPCPTCGGTGTTWDTWECGESENFYEDNDDCSTCGGLGVLYEGE